MDGLPDTSSEMFVENDLEILRRSAFDAIVMGVSSNWHWEQSAGARREKAEANKLGIKVIIGMTALQLYLYEWKRRRSTS
jgi:hypothetical protein